MVYLGHSRGLLDVELASGSCVWVNLLGQKGFEHTASSVVTTTQSQLVVVSLGPPSHSLGGERERLQRGYPWRWLIFGFGLGYAVVGRT